MQSSLCVAHGTVFNNSNIIEVLSNSIWMTAKAKKDQLHLAPSSAWMWLNQRAACGTVPAFGALLRAEYTTRSSRDAWNL